MRTHTLARPLIVLTVAALLAAGCAQGSATRDDDSGGGVTLNYLTFSAAPDHVEDLETIVGAFEAEHPDIDIQVETAPFDEYFTKLQTAVAGGTAPDTFELNLENFASYADSGALLDLGPLAADDGEFSPEVFAPSSSETFQYDGAQYGLPASFSAVLLLYNADLFDAAGLEYPTADWTWAEEQAAAEALTDLDAGVYGDFQPVQFFEFYKTLAQTGGQFLSDDGTTATFNDEAGVRAANWLVGKVGKVMPTEAEIGGTPDFDTELFKSGKLGMWHNGNWQFAGLADVGFEWNAVVEPGDTTKASAVFQNAAVASASTEHPQQAWEWLRFLTASQTTVDTRIESSWELPALADQSQFAAYLEQDPPASRQAVLDSLDAGTPPPVVVPQQQMQDIVTGHLTEAAAGRVPVQEALDNAAAEVNELLQE